MNWLRLGLFAFLLAGPTNAQSSGKVAFEAFKTWRNASADRMGADWGKIIAEYRRKLISEGLGDAAVTRAVQAIEMYDEGEWYDKVYAGTPTFNTQPNRLLVDAVKGRRPGRALDVAMGQGRNSVFLASQGWNVTGFDVARTGLKRAEELARARSVKITTVFSSDQDFEFGKERWDLIALIYAIEKRSVQRVRAALKPGGLVVVEAGHKSVSDAPFEYDSGELARIFDGFRILRDEEVTDVPDWGKEPIRLVRFVAQKKR